MDKYMTWLIRIYIINVVEMFTLLYIASQLDWQSIALGLVINEVFLPTKSESKLK